ncbi:MBL fold metallo-hydrolase RNA specificity domain-containing protein [Thauera chlorobenzoica]|uniref:RNA processing exonuclease n=1 Tax=Thauera chlorobenzoica TaxID=96773 RepID=A0A1H5TS11_9RHOO|nr:MBL fold metallo-hydrolase [Thauera chlorobenzoica]APR06023.1 RNA processing exonuclease [Thauera chlorobenzoica]SEF65556.1 metallo-beta-lactamase family protein [Thauera chlorobenzoica]
MKLTFYGAAGEVTGSCLRVDHEGGSFLVDCGLFQGGREADRKNRQALDFDLRGIDFVLLTHAHLDHSGLVPRLVALGYKRCIYATAATVDLLGVMLMDSAHIQEKEAEWALRNARARKARRRVEPTPLYTVEQARSSLGRLRAVSYDTPYEPGPGVRCRFRDAGHILGSAVIEIEIDVGGHTRSLVVSGDLGQPMRPVLHDPTPIRRADYLCIESTYGNRAHRSFDATCVELAAILRHTLQQAGGNVIIPAFAVGRTQEMLFVLAELVRSGRIERLDVVVDSPMAAAATQLTVRHADLWDDETRELYAWTQRNTDRFRLRFVQDVEESMALNSVGGGLVIISASGMCDAGRIRHHLRYNLGRRECAIVITGFQAAGTLGRRLVDGARQVSLFGERITVQARIHTIGGLSAHADQPALLNWLRHFEAAPRRTFIVHGEAEAAAAFAVAAEHELGWPALTVAEPLVPYLLG